MFDRTVVHHKDGDTHIDVKQLPHDTADAARLYGEMVKKTQDEVLGAIIRAAGADIRVAIIKLEASKNFANFDTQVRVLFEVNGYKYDVKVTESELDDTVHRKIAEHLVIEVMATLQRSKGYARTLG